MHTQTDRRAIPAYLVATWVVSSAFYYLIIKSVGTTAANGAYATGLMWSPAVGALVACRYLRRPVASLGWQWGETRWQALSYLVPIAYCLILYSIVWGTGLAPRSSAQTADAFARFFGLGEVSRSLGTVAYFAIVATIGVIENCATTLGEEIGWRGFLVPELSKHFSFTATSLISGIIWAAWHVPIIVFAGYNAGTGWIGLGAVCANIIVLSFVLTWLRQRSGSLWTGVIFHASHNHLIQHFFEPATDHAGVAKYIVGEFGFGLTVIGAAFAFCFWLRRAELGGRGSDA